MLKWGTSRPRNTATGKDPEQSRKRAVQTLIVLFILAVLVGTPLLSIALYPTDERNEQFTIRPGGHYAMRFDFHGFGVLEYSYYSSGGFGHIIELNKRNYERFIAGEPYDYWTLSPLWRGDYSGAGFRWEVFLVFVNEGPDLMFISFEAEKRVYFSLFVAGGITATMSVVAFALHRQWTGGAVTPGRAPVGDKRKIFALIAGLTILPIATFLAIGWLMPAGTLFTTVGVGYSYILSVIFAIAAAFILRFRLTAVEGDPEQVLSDLAHRLRISRFRVSSKPGQLIITTSSIAAVKVKARRTSEGTVIIYQSSATPSGWSIILILLLVMYTGPVALAISLYILYKASIFASTRIKPRLSQLPIPTLHDQELDARGMLIDGLSEGHRLSAEAYEAARSTYQDHILIVVTMGIILFLTVVLSAGFYLLQDIDAETRVPLAFLIGLVSALAFMVISWRRFASKAVPALRELKSWKARLDRALTREVAHEDLPDDEPCSFEMMADSLREIPKWMRIRKKAGMFRQPLHWILIVLFAYSAIMAAFMSVLSVGNGQSSAATWSIAFSSLFACLALAIYLRWRKSQREEYEATVKDWAIRHDELMADVEAYLRSV